MDAKEFKRGDIERLRDEAQNCAGAGVKWMTITERPEAIAELAKIALAALPSDAAQAPEPDCWAILTPNGSRLVSPEEAKGRRDAYPLYAAPVAADAAAPSHTDDAAVDEFAAAMKEKLAQARAKGRGGWETCNPADLSRMLREHVEKGDPRDVANFCMFLWFHRSPITSTQPDERAAFDLPPLPAPLEIDWPELHSHALGCGVEDRNIRDRYEAAEYGWQDGADKAAERVPEEIFTADQMREYALAAVARATAPQATVTDDDILDEYAKHVRTTYAGGVNVLSAMEPEGFVKAVRALLMPMQAAGAEVVCQEIRALANPEGAN